MANRTVLMIVVLAVLSPTIALGKQLRMFKAGAGGGKMHKEQQAWRLFAKNATGGKDAAGGNETSLSPGTDNTASNATDAASNATNDTATSAPETEAPTKEKKGCLTRKEPRAKAWFAETSPPGTSCVFGVDVRDEGAHCIQEQEYGSFGWCFTKADKSSWGSCGEDCPLSGHAKVLGKRIDKLTGTVGDLADTVKSSLGDSGDATEQVKGGKAKGGKGKRGKGGPGVGKKKKAGLAQAKTQKQAEAETKKLGKTGVGKAKARTHTAAKKNMKNVKKNTKPKASLAQAKKSGAKVGKTKMHAVAKTSKAKNTNQKKSRVSALGISSQVKQQEHTKLQHTEHRSKPQQKTQQSASHRVKHQLKQHAK